MQYELKKREELEPLLGQLEDLQIRKGKKMFIRFLISGEKDWDLRPMQNSACQCPLNFSQTFKKFALIGRILEDLIMRSLSPYCIAILCLTA